MAVPVFETERLILRGLELADAPRLQLLAGDYDVARWTENIPHPYPDGLAEDFIKRTQAQAEVEPLETYTWGIVSKAEKLVIGGIGLMTNRKHQRAEIGYWVGKPYWRQGYTTEASQKVIQFGFERLGLNRIYAMCVAQNVGSSGVMKKLGMVYEGTKRQHAHRDGQIYDYEFYAILRDEYEQRKTQ